MITDSQPPRVAVGAVVVEQRSDGPYVILVKRMNAPNQSRWSLPGGRVERGEALADAVAREVREETGLAVRVGRLLEVVELIDRAFHFIVLDYACEPTGGTLCAGDDAADVQSVPAFDLAEFDLSPSVLRVISRALSDEHE